MRPIFSATHTYNYALAKWLGEKLKPLSCNLYTVTDTFQFVNEVQSLKINRGDILVSYDVTSLFTNVPLDESIKILTDKDLSDDWFNANGQVSANVVKKRLTDLNPARVRQRKTQQRS